MHTRFSKHHLGKFITLASISEPRFSRNLTRIALVFIGFLILFMLFTPWVQTATGYGEITALSPNDRAQSINALVKGRVNKWYVLEGSYVKAGDPIVELVDNDEKLLERLESQLTALRRNVEATKIAEQTADLDYERQKNLFEHGLSSKKKFEQAKIKYKALLTKRLDAQNELEKLEVSVSRQAVQIIKAPREGTIVSILAGGNITTVKQGQALATFVPSEVPHVATLYISGLDIPLVYPGRKVRLQFEGWPTVQFSGWPSVAIGTFSGIVRSTDPIIHKDGRFRVIVESDPEGPAWPNEQFLRFGAKTRGWILLETVSVGYEVWRQLNNFPPKITPHPESDTKSHSTKKGSG